MGGRGWTVEQKRVIVEEYESAPYGAKAAVLRRHGASDRQVRLWASYRDAGVLESGLRKGWQARMTPRAESAEIGRLRAEVKRLEAELEQARKDRWMAEAAAEALGKASALLQVMLESAEQDQLEGSSPPVSGS
jgi:transposase